ncbi:MAG TPA: bifunctional adenosylcobinamide kinase/adenosylcobinamide-phosphate guanylyltransferase [Dongiaceae bacterium]|nr:bifunctional adenosylcobinamide kinase/adenosylcobinamide-phosphate guanylyltransferase [Dongiaceae bacterium]
MSNSPGNADFITGTDLILGGARSGKSALAEQRARASGKRVVYVATAEARDGEMSNRIGHHRQRRPADWQTVEEPLHLAQALREHQQLDTLILVDCLTLWLSNLLCREDDALLQQEKAALLDHLATNPDLILVSNETGLGVVPLGELSRRFVDEAGWLHQATAAQARRVTLVVAGLPLQLKPQR